MYKQRKQDSIIFVGNDTKKEWLDHLIYLEQKIFSSDCPIFMPGDYSGMMDLRLDSNIIFYQKEEEGTYNLIDKFSVNGQNPIAIKLGKWCSTCNGVKLEKSMNRWERRTDLMGASFINTPKKNGHVSDFIYDKNNNIIGSKGWYQEVLFYVINHLNLTVKTEENKEEQNGIQLPCYANNIMEDVVKNWKKPGQMFGIPEQTSAGGVPGVVFMLELDYYVLISFRKQFSRAN